jgi:hypothetical protein
MQFSTRTFLFFSFMLGSSLSAMSQAVITADNFPRGTTFTDYSYRSLPGVIAPPTEGPDQVWDYSSLQLDQIFAIEYTDATQDPALPEALNSSERNLAFQVFPIPSQHYEAIDQDGWYGYGRTTADARYSITAISGGPKDTLRFPGTAMPFEGRINNLQFPATYGDHWSQSMTEVMPFELTVAAFGLNKTPGAYRRLIHQDRSITGHGQMVLPREDGGPTLPVEVLMIKVVRTAVDSYYLGGMPAPAQLMGAFGLTQGSTTADSFYIFYAPDFGAPVFDYAIGSDIAFYRPYAEATVSVNRDIPTTVLHAFPNPVKAGGILNVELESPAQQGRYRICDALGRIVDESVFTTVDPHQLMIPISAAIQSGMYVVQVLDTEGHVQGILRQMVQQE